MLQAHAYVSLSIECGNVETMRVRRRRRCCLEECAFASGRPITAVKSPCFLSIEKNRKLRRVKKRPMNRARLPDECDLAFARGGKNLLEPH